MIEEGWLTKVKSIEVKIWGLVSKSSFLIVLDRNMRFDYKNKLPSKNRLK